MAFMSLITAYVLCAISDDSTASASASGTDLFSFMRPLLESHDGEIKPKAFDARAHVLNHCAIRTD